MDNNILSTIRRSKGFSRSVAILISLALIGVILERTIYYTLNESGIIEDENVVEKIQRIAPHEARRLGLGGPNKYNPEKYAAKPESDETQFAYNVQNIKEQLAALDSPYETVDVKQLAEQIAVQSKNLDALNEKILANFAETQQHIEDKNLPAVIMQRQLDTVALYNEKFSTLKHKLLAIELATTLDEKKFKLMQAKEWLSEQQFKRKQQEFDPNNLPFKTAKPNPDNKPKTSPESFM